MDDNNQIADENSNNDDKKNQQNNNTKDTTNDLSSNTGRSSSTSTSTDSSSSTCSNKTEQDHCSKIIKAIKTVPSKKTLRKNNNSNGGDDDKDDYDGMNIDDFFNNNDDDSSISSNDTLFKNTDTNNNENSTNGNGKNSKNHSTVRRGKKVQKTITNIGRNITKKVKPSFHTPDDGSATRYEKHTHHADVYMNTRSKARPLNKTSDTGIVATKVQQSNVKEQPKRKNPNHEISSDDDKIRWIACINDDLFVCKHQYNHSYYFEYSEEDLIDFFQSWFLNACRENKGEFQCVYDEDDFKQKDFDQKEGFSQYIQVQYHNRGWYGKMKMKCHNKVEYLPHDFITGNFKDPVIQQWKTNPGRWHKVPPGLPKDHVSSITPMTAPILHYTKQKLKYTQGNLHLCMLASFSSCLHHMGMIKEAQNLMRSVAELEAAQEIYSAFHNIVARVCKPFTLIRDKNFNFDQAEDHFTMPTMVVLEGKDGSCDHAITVHGTMIFDSSHTTILQMCKETLDWCCPPLGFQKVHCAYTLKRENNPNKKQKTK